mmetsp:Transcript_17905/g.26411  ORF Transcript_17905/g.26411 Transcript_17905/m.26411 type:complete len:95 (-) Transcript_17905:219-503(-)
MPILCIDLSEYLTLVTLVLLRSPTFLNQILESSVAGYTGEPSYPTYVQLHTLFHVVFLLLANRAKEPLSTLFQDLHPYTSEPLGTTRLDSHFVT